MRDNHNDAHPPNPPIVVRYFIHTWLGKKQRRRIVYRHSNVSSIHLNSDQLFIIFKMATIVGDVTEQIISEFDLFGSIIKQNVIRN